MVSKFLPVFRKRISVEAVIKHPWHVLSWIFKILNTCTYSYWRFSNLHCILYRRWDRWREWKIPCTDLHVHVGRLKQLWLKHFQCMKKIFKPIAEDLIRSGNLFFLFLMHILHCHPVPVHFNPSRPKVSTYKFSRPISVQT